MPRAIRSGFTSQDFYKVFTHDANSFCHHTVRDRTRGSIMQIRRIALVTFVGSLSALTTALAVATGVMSGSEDDDQDRGGFNSPGNVLITDQFNNRVVEVNPETHEVVWTFGDGSSVPGPNSIVGTNDAERVGHLTLIAGTGAPGGTEPTCPPPNGCPDNRVLLVNRHGKIVWQYGQAGVSGAGPDQLNTPVANVFLPNGNIMITDQANERVIIVTPDKRIVWQYGTGVSGIGFNQLNNPNSAELLNNGHILIADENNNRVIEVTPETHQIVWQYPATPDTALLNGAAFASRLPDGHTLITDSNNNRVIEVTEGGTVVFSYSTLDPAGNPNPLPTRAVRLSQGGLTLISDQFNDRVIAVTKAGQIVFLQGMLNVPGNGFNQLNAPYSAYTIGNYFGLTPPRFHGDQ